MQVKLVNNRVVTTERITPTDLSFERASGSEFCDVRIRSEDGKEFDAHRVVLSARLEYFRAMFSCGWIEVFVVQN
jgi:BTB/POZ domain